MPALQHPLPTAELHRNRQLFSDYYLNITLPRRPEWRLLAGDARPVMEAIKAIFAGFTPSSNETQTEHGLIESRRI